MNQYLETAIDAVNTAANICRTIQNQLIKNDYITKSDSSQVKYAAGAIIVQEAGGSVTDMNGKDLDFSIGKKLLKNHGIVVTNGLLHSKLLEAINK